MSVLPLVVNGLHRSGTTMLGRLIDSQEKMTCFTDTFSMLHIIAQLRRVGGKEEIMMESFEDEKNTFHEATLPQLRLQLAHSMVDTISAAAPTSGVTGPHTWSELTQIYGMPFGKLLDLIKVIYVHDNITDLASLLQSIGEHVGVELAATKWTCHHRYAPIFLKNPDAYWLEIVRHPYTRYGSVSITHKWPETPLLHLEQMNDAIGFAALFKHKRFKVIRYEDLCHDTKTTLEAISEWLGMEIKSVDLRNPIGGLARPNSTENVLAQKDLFYHDDNQPSRISAENIDKWGDALSSVTKAIINETIDFQGLYEKEAQPIEAKMQAKWRMKKAWVADETKKSIKKLLRSLGYTIDKVPPEFSI